MRGCSMRVKSITLPLGPLGGSAFAAISSIGWGGCGGTRFLVALRWRLIAAFSGSAGQHPPSGRVIKCCLLTASNGEGEAGVAFRLGKYFSSPQNRAAFCFREVHPPRACHLPVPARPSQREGDDIVRSHPLNPVKSPQREGVFSVQTFPRGGDASVAERVCT